MSSADSEVTPLVPKHGSTASDIEEQGGELNKDADMCTTTTRLSRPIQKDVTPTWNETMRKIWPFLKPGDCKHSSYAILALFSILLGKMLNVLPPLAIKYAVDAIGKNVDSTTIMHSSWDQSAAATPVIHAIATYFVLKGAIMLNGIVQDLAQRTVALDAERRFANAIFSHLQHLSLSYHLEKHIGEVTRIMNRGSDSISTVMSSFLFYVLPTFFEAAIVSVVFWKLVKLPSIAISTMVAIFLYLFFTIFVTKTRIAFRRKLIEASDHVGQKETETLVNYETVAMFGRTKYEIEQYSNLRQIYKDRRVEMLSMFALLEFGQKFIKLCGSCAGLLIAGVAAIYGEDGLTAGTFVIVQMYIDQLFQPLTQLGWQYRMITQSFTDLEKAVTMLNRVPEVRDSPDAIQWQRSNSDGCEIVLSNVTFHYKVSSKRRPLGTALDSVNLKGLGGGKHGGRRGRLAMGFVDDGVDKRNQIENDGDEEIQKLGGVENINFRIASGKTVALVGKSGSGKTTIVRLILRMYDCDEGSIQVDGLDVKSVTQESLRDHIGVVAQDTILFNGTVRENIIYGKENATEREIEQAMKLSALESFIERLPNGLETVVGERGMKLSGGERQRVGLARCIIKNPQILLLDEATSALDSSTEKEIQHNIASLRQGRTTIMIAHRLSTARNADEIIVLDKGCIIERGPHEELLKGGGRYAEMWKIQTGI